MRRFRPLLGAALTGAVGLSLLPHLSDGALDTRQLVAMALLLAILGLVLYGYFKRQAWAQWFALGLILDDILVSVYLLAQGGGGTSALFWIVADVVLIIEIFTHAPRLKPEVMVAWVAVGAAVPFLLALLAWWGTAAFLAGSVFAGGAALYVCSRRRRRR